MLLRTAEELGDEDGELGYPSLGVPVPLAHLIVTVELSPWPDGKWYFRVDMPVAEHTGMDAPDKSGLGFLHNIPAFFEAHKGATADSFAVVTVPLRSLLLSNICTSSLCIEVFRGIDFSYEACDKWEPPMLEKVGTVFVCIRDLFYIRNYSARVRALDAFNGTEPAKECSIIVRRRGAGVFLGATQIDKDDGVALGTLLNLSEQGRPDYIRALVSHEEKRYAEIELPPNPFGKEYSAEYVYDGGDASILSGRVADTTNVLFEGFERLHAFLTDATRRGDRRAFFVDRCPPHDIPQELYSVVSSKNENFSRWISRRHILSRAHAACSWTLPMPALMPWRHTDWTRRCLAYWRQALRTALWMAKGGSLSEADFNAHPFKCPEILGITLALSCWTLPYGCDRNMAGGATDTWGPIHHIPSFAKSFDEFEKRRRQRKCDGGHCIGDDCESRVQTLLMLWDSLGMMQALPKDETDVATRDTMREQETTLRGLLLLRKMYRLCVYDLRSEGKPCKLHMAAALVDVRRLWHANMQPLYLDADAHSAYHVWLSHVRSQRLMDVDMPEIGRHRMDDKSVLPEQVLELTGTFVYPVPCPSILSSEVSTDQPFSVKLEDHMLDHTGIPRFRVTVPRHFLADSEQHRILYGVYVYRQQAMPTWSVAGSSVDPFAYMSFVPLVPISAASIPETNDKLDPLARAGVHIQNDGSYLESSDVILAMRLPRTDDAKNTLYEFGVRARRTYPPWYEWMQFPERVPEAPSPSSSEDVGGKWTVVFHQWKSTDTAALEHNWKRMIDVYKRRHGMVPVSEWMWPGLDAYTSQPVRMVRFVESIESRHQETGHHVARVRFGVR